MKIQGDRITLTLEDKSVLFFDFFPLWGGFYVLDALASPEQVTQAGRESVKNAFQPVPDADLKMFFKVSEGEHGLGLPLSLHAGRFNTVTTSHGWSHDCVVPGGNVISVSLV
jgi:hypothetical protein